MLKKFKIYAFIIFSSLILISCTSYTDRDEGEKFIKNSDRIWAIDFEPSYTEIFKERNKNANLVLINNKNKIMNFREKAYFIPGMEYFGNKLFYQNHLGVKEFNSKKKQDNILENRKTRGYEMSGILKEVNLYYFLVNESFKKDRYASQIIVGDLNEQKLAEIDGYILGHGNDGKNLYLISDDSERLENWIIQKFEISNSKEVNKISEKKLTFKTEHSPSSKFIIHGDYIYVYTAVNPNISDEIIGNPEYYMLKFSKDSLELISKTFLFKNDSKSDDYILISDKAIFIKEDKMYIPTKGGKVFSFNTLNDEFKEEFSLKDYKFTQKKDTMACFNEKTEDISFLYNPEDDEKKYTIVVYDLEGNIKEKIDFDKPEEVYGYPHSFIRIK